MFINVYNNACVDEGTDIKRIISGYYPLRDPNITIKMWRQKCDDKSRKRTKNFQIKSTNGDYFDTFLTFKLSIWLTSAYFEVGGGCEKMPQHLMRCQGIGQDRFLHLSAKYSIAKTGHRGTFRMLVLTAGISHSRKRDARRRENQMT